jgi:hypothetical protein
MIKAIIYLIVIIFSSLIPGHLVAQDWKFEKEKDGIKIYTREEEGNFKSYRGETEFQAGISEVLDLIENVEMFINWDDDISEMKLLQRDKGKNLTYYTIYDVPWPFTDRDLCVKETIITDPVTGVVTVTGISVPDAVPLNKDCVRIINFHEKWVLEPLENGFVHVMLEGFADPEGDIPAWVANLAITDTPLNMLKAIREQSIKH